ncbi:MAG TPA: hypothetical protein VK737_09330 [Opitutales bacterium]|nr:hypothetical protein [Opitutales bacterium]
MEATVKSPAPAPPMPPDAMSAAPARPLRRLLLWVGLAAFGVYLLLLFVLALDQHFQWGLFPTKADREITALINQLDDQSLAPDQRLAVMDKIVEWNSFAVPVLITTIAKAPMVERDAAVQCLQEISLKYYGKDIAPLGVDAIKLNQWWALQQAEWAKQESEKKP